MPCHFPYPYGHTQYMFTRLVGRHVHIHAAGVQHFQLRCLLESVSMGIYVPSSFFRLLWKLCIRAMLTRQQGTLHPEVVYLPFLKRAAVAFITRKINKAAFVLRLFDVPSMQRSMQILFSSGIMLVVAKWMREEMMGKEEFSV
jgi:hypothetical protein